MHGKVHCLLRIVLRDLDARMCALVVEAPVVDTLWEVVGRILEDRLVGIDPGGVEVRGVLARGQGSQHQAPIIVLAQLHELEADGSPVAQAAAAAEQGVSSQAGPLLAGTGWLPIKLPATGQSGQVFDLRG